MPRHKRSSDQRPKEYKASPIFVVNADEGLGIVEAITSVFGVIDDGKDVVHPGAFTKTIVERAHRLKVLDQHNTDSLDRILGKIVSIRELSRDELPADLLEKFPTATGGLYVKMQFNMKVQRSRETYYKIAAGDVTEYSFGYDPLDADHEEREVNGRMMRIRNLRTVRLWEISPVIWGMNAATATVGVKSTETQDDEVQDPKKELTSEGPLPRLGDSLHANLLGTLTSCLTHYYGEGFLVHDEYESILELGITHLHEIRTGITDDIALRPTSIWYYMERMSLPMMFSEAKPVDETDDYIRVRIFDSDECQEGSLRTVTLSADDGIKAVVCRKDDDESTSIQSVLFAKDHDWTRSSALAWVRDHEIGKALLAVLEGTLVTFDQKIGRMLSASTASRIRAAVESLVALLKDAGVWAIAEEATEETASAGSSSEQPAAGTSPTPTVEHQKLLLRAKLLEMGR